MATGKRVWSTTIGGGTYREANHFMTSPRLYRDMVIACFDDTNPSVPGVVLTVDKRSGKELWRHVVKGEPLPRFPEGPGRSRPGSSPLVVDVDGTAVCILGTGQAIRLPDGKLYDVKLGTTLVPFAVDEKNDALFAGTSTDGGSCRYGMDLSLVSDELKAELAWVVGYNARGYNVVFHDGRLYWDGYILDPTTGYPFGVGVPETRKDRHRRYGFHGQQRSAPQTRQFMLVANGHVYGLHEQKSGPKGEEQKFGMLEVYTAAGRRLSESRLVPSAATDALRDQGFGDGSYSYSCAMSIGKDALYLVDNRFLYCFGKGK